MKNDGLVPPLLSDADRPSRKVYPPIRWWPLRVMNPWQKAGFLVGYLALGIVVSRLLQLVVPLAVAEIILEPFHVVGIVALVRSFRGADEPIAPPRAWWRLTARPRAGWWLAAMYFFCALGFARQKDTITDWMFGVESGLWTAAFLNSSIRLTVQRRRAR